MISRYPYALCFALCAATAGCGTSPIGAAADKPSPDVDAANRPSPDVDASMGSPLCTAHPYGLEDRPSGMTVAACINDSKYEFAADVTFVGETGDDVPSCFLDRPGAIVGYAGMSTVWGYPDPLTNGAVNTTRWTFEDESGLPIHLDFALPGIVAPEVGTAMAIDVRLSIPHSGGLTGHLVLKTPEGAIHAGVIEGRGGVRAMTVATGSRICLSGSDCNPGLSASVFSLTGGESIELGSWESGVLGDFLISHGLYRRPDVDDPGACMDDGERRFWGLARIQ